MKILIIEDDLSTADYVVSGLRQEGHDLDHTANGLSGLELAVSRNYDVLVVDRMLPGLDGLSMVRAFRLAGRDTPVLFLTSLGGVDDRVEGLEAGADDYLLKPFAFSELVARVNALGRRAPSRKEESVLKVAGIEMQLVARTITRDGILIELQPREFRLLEHFMRNKGRILTRTMLLERVWEFHFDPKTNVVETHVSRLRTKVDKPFDKELIRTIRGAGYCFNPLS